MRLGAATVATAALGIALGAASGAAGAPSVLAKLPAAPTRATSPATRGDAGAVVPGSAGPSRGAPGDAADARERLLDDPRVFRLDYQRRGESLETEVVPADPYTTRPPVFSAGGLKDGLPLAAGPVLRGVGPRPRERPHRVAVIDSEIDIAHPDIAPKVAAAPTPSASTRPPTGPPTCARPTPRSPGRAFGDNDLHGSHVAGLAAAATDNGVGVSGAGFAASLMAVKVTLTVPAAPPGTRRSSATRSRASSGRPTAAPRCSTCRSAPRRTTRRWPTPSPTRPAGTSCSWRRPTARRTTRRGPGPLYRRRSRRARRRGDRPGRRDRPLLHERGLRRRRGAGVPDPRRGTRGPPGPHRRPARSWLPVAERHLDGGADRGGARRAGARPAARPHRRPGGRGHHRDRRRPRRARARPGLRRRGHRRRGRAAGGGDRGLRPPDPAAPAAALGRGPSALRTGTRIRYRCTVGGRTVPMAAARRRRRPRRPSGLPGRARARWGRWASRCSAC